MRNLGKTGVLFACLATLAMTFAPNIALARISGPVGDSASAGCLALQNEADALVAESKGRNVSDARRQEINARAQEIGRIWRQTGCFDAFGYIQMEIRNPNNNVQQQGTGGVAR